ncbi:COG1361 S-layer family protein [Candidatus Woesearchaeota archaeon]|nr:MAG: hypothetical protein QS99_C0019G0014 [archaeon GW2011_AR4]MBS3130402.1 COG1361 S-layer family protein [Candidatus Woesearchaeota archaeon]HIH38665.1 hypothetical protein [Candidatus Woesearchaeota archaeon]HIJ03541.1 hypothetical protein [Candidatus Woesearchaeota archaeon]
MKGKRGYILLLVLIISALIVHAAGSDSQLILVNLVNQDPDPAMTGDIVELRFGVSNKGGQPAENVVLEIIPEYPFSMVPGESSAQRIDILKAYQYDTDSKILKFRLRIDKDATAGKYELKVNEYREGSTVTAQKSITLDVKSKESAEIIHLDQVELIPGKVTPLKFTINNVGSAPLRDLSFQWENSEDIVLPVGSDNTKYIKYIDVGESVDLDFNVIASANADPDLYKLDLSLTYDDPITGTDKTIQTKAGVYVGGATDFDVAYSGTANGEYTFSLSNVGSVSASSVTVKIPEQSGWRVSGSNSVIIGNLNKGDYTIASFTLQQSSGGLFSQVGSQNVNPQEARQRGNITDSSQKTSRETPIKMEIIYTDSRGNRNTVTKEVAVNAQSALQITDTAAAGTSATGRRFTRQSASQVFWAKAKWLIAPLILLIFWFIVRGKVKKGRLEDPSYNAKRAIGELLFPKRAKEKKKERK